MFCLALRPGLKRFREEFEREGVEAFAYMDAVSFGRMKIAAGTVRAFAFLRRELEDVGVVVNPTKTIARPPKGYAPTAEGISLLLIESVDVRIAVEGGVTGVGVPIGTDEFVLDRAKEVVRDERADRLARCLASMPDKQAATLITNKSLGQRTSCLERALDTGISLETCRRAENGAQWAYENILELHRAAEAQSFFQEGCPANQLTLNPHQQAQARFSIRAEG